MNIFCKYETLQYTEKNGSIIRSMIKFISRKDSPKPETAVEVVLHHLLRYIIIHDISLLVK